MDNAAISKLLMTGSTPPMNHQTGRTLPGLLRTHYRLSHGRPTLCRDGSKVNDVVVVGGGPAGAAAAIDLAQGGLDDVTLLDKASFPRDKTCGDGLTTHALRQLERLGLERNTVASWQRVDEVVVRAPSGHEATFPMPRGRATYAAVARRIDLDSALVDVARQYGVKVFDGHACTAVREHPDHVALEVEGLGYLRTPWVVAADGMWSSVRKHLGQGVPGYRGEWRAFRQYFSGVGPRAAREMFIWFDLDLLPGYAWSFPLPGNRANVGFAIRRGGMAKQILGMPALWRDLLERPHIRAILGDGATPEESHRAWHIPARIDRMPLTTRRTLFVGDAAAAADIMTAEGIGQALLTGSLAAEAILAANSKNWSSPATAAVVAAHYRRQVARARLADHRMSVSLVRVLKHPKGAQGAIRFASATRWTRHNFVRWLFEDHPRAILFTPQHWHRGALSGWGTYRDDSD